MKIIYLFALTCSLSLVTCKENETIRCAQYSVRIVITVNGRILDNYFTIREKTGDTIRIWRDTTLRERNQYPVFGDTYHSLIKGKTENFRFQGFINDTLVVNEPFVIKADECHVDYVSGKYVVDL